MYFSPKTVIMIKTRKIRWANHVWGKETLNVCTKFVLESPKRRDHSENLHVGGGIILKCI